MPPARSVRISPKHSSVTSNLYNHRGQKISTSPSPRQPSILIITFTELTTYFTTANDQLYNILDGDLELRRIIHAIEVLTTSNHALEAIRRRQEQYMMCQFQLALENELHGRVAPMIKRQCIID